MNKYYLIGAVKNLAKKENGMNYLSSCGLTVSYGNQWTGGVSVVKDSVLMSKSAKELRSVIGGYKGFCENYKPAEFVSVDVICDDVMKKMTEELANKMLVRD